jgi:hypothetical protein
MPTLQLGADAVGGGDQDRVGEAGGGLRSKSAPKPPRPAMPPGRAVARRPARCAHEGVAGVDVDAGLGKPCHAVQEDAAAHPEHRGGAAAAAGDAGDDGQFALGGEADDVARGNGGVVDHHARGFGAGLDGLGGDVVEGGGGGLGDGGDIVEEREKAGAHGDAP